MQYDKQTLKSTLVKLTAQLTTQLPNISNTPIEQLKHILLKYDQCFAINFVRWLSATHMQCKSAHAREVCLENLNCELNENHQAMLNNLVKPIKKPVIFTTRLQSLIHALTFIVEDPREGLMVMAALENLSLGFVSWMRKAAEKIGLDNMVFFDVHGEADIDHAEKFIDAVLAEHDLQNKVTHLDDRSNDIYLGSIGLILTNMLLEEIFLANYQN